MLLTRTGNFSFLYANTKTLNEEIEVEKTLLIIEKHFVILDRNKKYQNTRLEERCYSF